MVDRFQSRAEEQTGGIRRGIAITPNDGADLAAETRALYVGSAGDVALILVSGDAITFASVPAGTLLPVRAMRVKATGTTAGLLLGLR